MFKRLCATATLAILVILAAPLEKASQSTNRTSGCIFVTQAEAATQSQSTSCGHYNTICRAWTDEDGRSFIQAGFPINITTN